MAKSKKKTSGKKPVPQAPKKEASWPWIALLGGLLALIAVLVLVSLLPKGRSSGSQSTDPSTPSEAPGVTAPVVDDSDTKTMRIVKAGTAYVEKSTSAGTVFSFRLGDKVEVVEMDHEWVTIAVEGHGYYLPRNMVRGLDEHVIVIDAGHQLRDDIGKEAVGPGSSDEVQKMDTGAVGIETGQQEYDVTLATALALQSELESRGYTVYLTRNHNGVNISNKERTDVANNLNADAYISLHTGWSEDAQAHGFGAVCQSSSNTYVSDLQAQNKELCQAILTAMAKSTEIKSHGIREDDKLAGINWSGIPTALIEVGFLSNADNDRLLSLPSHHEKLAQGIADGLDSYFAEDDE